jgi:catechol 2,3-dioxygenase-like lactoylglutathione lyase family enzyme
MALHLFAGLPVADFTAALPWYENLLGSPLMFPHDTEAVWQLAEERMVYVVQRPEHAGHGLVTVMVDDLDAHVAGIAQRGIEPAKEEEYGNGVRKTTYVDPDGNEIAFGSAPGEGP